MQLEQLNHIIKVAKHRNISNASKELLISQSALSQSILKLEKELNITIFDRKRNGVTPTIDGQNIIDHAIEVLKKVECITDYAKTLNTRKKSIKIGVIEGLHLNFISNLLEKLKKQFLNINFEFIELSSLNICKKLIHGELDLGLLAIYDETNKFKKQIKFKNVKKIDMCVFLSKNSHLANEEKIYPGEIINEIFITYNGEYMNDFFSRYQEKYGYFKELITTKNNETISKVVKDNLAIAIEIKPEIKNKYYIETGDIIAKPLMLDASFKEDYLGIAYLYSEDFIIDKNKKKLIKILENELSTL